MYRPSLPQLELENRNERVQKDLLHGMGTPNSRPDSGLSVRIPYGNADDSFAIPAVYYMTRYRLPKGLPLRLTILGLGIGAQGVIGWFMVKSGLSQDIIDTNSVPRVSQYRLAAHFSAAVTLYIGMLYTALSLRRDMKGAQPLANSVPMRRFKTLAHVAGAMVFVTAISGAFVAGLDAGLVYNEFPTMGGRIVPPIDELMDSRYAKSETDLWWRNIFENPVTAQFDHRLFVSSVRGRH